MKYVQLNGESSLKAHQLGTSTKIIIYTVSESMGSVYVIFRLPRDHDDDETLRGLGLLANGFILGSNDWFKQPKWVLYSDSLNSYDL